jgi:hypothetical protein
MHCVCIRFEPINYRSNTQDQSPEYGIKKSKKFIFESVEAISEAISEAIAIIEGNLISNVS